MSTLGHKRRKTTSSPESEDIVCTPSTPANISSSTDTSNTPQINLETTDELIELCTPSMSQETLHIPMSDPPSYSASDNTTAPFSTPSTTPLTSHKTLVADSQGCIHRKKVP